MSLVMFGGLKRGILLPGGKYRSIAILVYLVWKFGDTCILWLKQGFYKGFLAPWVKYRSIAILVYLV